MMKPPALCLLFAESGPSIGISGTPGNWTIGTAYTFTPSIVTGHGGGTPPYVWSIGSGTLPGWASLNTSTGVISGTPTDSADFMVTLHVVDAALLTADRLLTFLQHDANFSSVKTLLHFDGPDTSTTFTDVLGRVWSANSTGAKISTAQSQFGGSSLLLNGSTDYIQTPNTAGLTDFNFGTADFTIELRLRPNATISGDKAIFCVTGSGGVSFGVQGSSGKLFCGPNSVSYGTIGATTPTTNAWAHIAVSRVSGTMRIFLNGVVDATAADTVNYGMGNSTLAYIGAANSGVTPVDQFPGNVDELRITKGVGRYTANFTPSGFPFPNQ